MPLISVVTVCLNAAAGLPGALNSVLAQEFDEYDYVVIDGASTDGSVELLRDFAPRFGARLRWMSEPDRGIYEAMNKGLAAARGEYVAFLGADDRLAPGALAAVARALAREPRPEIVCGATRVSGQMGEWDEPARAVGPAGRPRRAPARHQSVFVAREAALAAGGFDTRYRIAADYDLYLRLLERGARQVFIKETLSRFALGGISSSNTVDTAREYRDVRIAHGASPVIQQLAMLKAVVASWAFALWMRAKKADR